MKTTAGIDELVFWLVVGSLLLIILIFLVGITCFLVCRFCRRKKERRALYLERELQARAIELERFHEVIKGRRALYWERELQARAIELERFPEVIKEHKALYAERAPGQVHRAGEIPRGNKGAQGPLPGERESSRPGPSS